MVMTLTHTQQAAAPAASAGFRVARARFRGWPAAARLARRGKTAQAKAAGVPIGPGERVLTLDRGPAGPLAAATAVAVYIGGQSGPGPAWCRLGWEEVTRARWDDRRCVLVLSGAGPGGMWRKEVALDQRSTLVELASERVSATLLASAVVRLHGRACAMVMARRQPGSGRVIWVTLLSLAGGPEDQEIRAKVAATLADLRAQTGIPAE
jgi:hypothetical protein